MPPLPARSALSAPAALCLALCLALAAGQAQARGCSKPITVGTGHWEPYAYYDAPDKFTGVDVDMARAIFREAGCTMVELPARPATRNALLFESGRIDMMMGASITPERLRRARFSLPYRRETVGMFSLAQPAGRYQSVRSFDQFLAGPLRMLAPRVGYYGDAYGRNLERLRDGKRLFQFLDFAQGIRMLEAGRADFVLGDTASVERAAARQGIRVQALPFLVVDAPVHLMLNRASVPEADVRLLDAAIARLRERGEFERISRSYAGN